MTVLNRARMATTTTGPGTITLTGSVTGYATFGEASAVNGATYDYTIEDGNDFEIGVGTYSISGPTFSRDTVTISKISGTAGTSKINLSGSAQIFISPRAATLGLTGKHTFNLPAGSWTRGASGSPSLGTVELAAGTDYVTTLDFDGTTQEYSYASLTLPKSYNLGTISFVVQGMSSSATSTVARIGVQAAAVSSTEAMAVTYGTGQFVTLTNGGTANRLLTSSESSAITIANTPVAADIIRLRLTRTPGDAADTMSEDFRIIEVRFFFTTNAGNDA
jgi:hypothetical protein